MVAWDMAELAIDAVEELAIGLDAALVGRKIEELAIGLAAVAAAALVGRKVEICP